MRPALILISSLITSAVNVGGGESLPARRTRTRSAKDSDAAFTAAAAARSHDWELLPTTSISVQTPIVVPPRCAQGAPNSLVPNENEKRSCAPEEASVPCCFP